MLPKNRRIPRATYPTDMRGALEVRSKHFSLRSLPSTDHARVGVTVSKKVSKEAHIRNTIRRRVYSAIGPSIKSLPKHQFIFTALKGAQNIKGEALKAELLELLNK